jgi:hypothetical protein
MVKTLMGSKQKHTVHGVYAAKVVSQAYLSRSGPLKEKKRVEALQHEVFLMNQIQSEHVINVGEFIITPKYKFII